MNWSQPPRVHSRRTFLRGAAILGGAAALGPNLAACTSGGGSSDAATAQFLTNEDNPDTIKIFKKYFQSYTDKHSDLKVDGQYLGDDVTQRLTQLVGSNTPPDFVKLDQGDIAEFVAAGLLEPVTDVVSKLGTVPDSLRLVWDGEDYIIPSETGYWMQFYRTDVYDKYGLKPGLVWDDFLSNLDALKGADISPNLFVTNSESGYLTDVTVNNLWSNDVTIWDVKDGEWVVTLDAPDQIEKALETLAYCQARAAASPESGNYSYSDVNQTYASGKIACIEYQGRTLKYLISENPALLDKTGVATQPYNTKLRSTAATAGFAIFKKGSSGKSDAIKSMLLDFLKGDTYLDYLWTVPGHLIPMTKEALQGEWRQNDFLQSRPDFLQVIDETYDDAFSYLRYPDKDSKRPNLAGGAATNVAIYSEMTSRVITKGDDPSTTVKEAAQKLRDLAEKVS